MIIIFCQPKVTNFIELFKLKSAKDSLQLTSTALRSCGISIPSARPVNPIKERIFILITKASLRH